MRQAGILMAVSSLPSKYGIGCFSKEVYRFIEFCKKSGHKCGCGADLIERKAKNTGKIWYGCSKFPKCKRTYFPQDDGSIKEAVKK